MLKQSQLNLEYKLQQPKPVTPFSTQPHQQPQRTTPAWISFAQHSPNREESPHHNHILKKIHKLDSIDLTNSSYSKLRLPESGSQLRVSQSKDESEKQFKGSSRDSKQMLNDSQLQTVTLREESKLRLLSTQMRTDSRIDKSLKNSDVTARHQRTGTIVKNKKQHTKPPSKPPSSRFKQITVHEYLYLQGKRQETKRTMEQVLDQQYKKEKIYTFKPILTQKSQELALAKFAKLYAKINLERQLMEEAERTSTQKGNRKQNKREISEAQMQKHRWKVLNQFFYFLSLDQQIISKQTLVLRVQELPLVLIQSIEKIIQKVYQGKQYSWLQFLGAVNDKKMVSNRQALIRVAEKWMIRQTNLPLHSQMKENIRTNL